MSVGHYGLLEAAKKYRAGGAGPKVTLLTIVERMGEVDGEWVCWPSMTTIAYDSEQTTGTVRRHLAAFEEAGLITRRSQGRGGGGRGPNLLVLNLDRLLPEQSAHDDRFAIEQSAHLELAKRASGGGQSAHLSTSAPYIEHPVEQPVKERAPTATRIPKPFSVTSEMRAWAAQEVPHVDLSAETRRFCDYWRAEAGAKARKLDWVATWRNWMRRANDRLVSTNGTSYEPTQTRFV